MHRYGSCRLERAKNVRRVAGAADRNQEISRASQAPERQREDLVEGDIIADGRHERGVIERAGAEVTVLAGVGRKVARHHRARAVAHEVDVLAPHMAVPGELDPPTEAVRRRQRRTIGGRHAEIAQDARRRADVIGPGLDVK